MSVGLDIGTTSIKAIWTRKNGNQAQLLGAGAIQAPVRGIFSESEQDLQSLAVVIRKLFTDTNIKSKDIVVGLPESEVVTKIIEMPSLSDNELASAIVYEAEQYIPLPSNEANISYDVIDRPTDKSAKMKVLLVATSKSLVEKYMMVTKMAGLNLIAIETNLISAARALLKPGSGTNIILEIGARNSSIGVFKEGQIVFSRTIPTAGEALTRAVSLGLSMDLAQAEEYKKAYGLSPEQLEGKIVGSIKPVFDVIATEVTKSIEFYRSMNPTDTIQNIVLSGGSSGLPEIIPNLAQKLGVQVVIGDPFGTISKDERMTAALEGYAPLYPVAVGLSLREN